MISTLWKPSKLGFKRKSCWTLVLLMRVNLQAPWVVARPRKEKQLSIWGVDEVQLQRVVLVNACQPTSTKGCGTLEEGEAIEYLKEDRQRFNIEASNGQCCLKWPKSVTDLITPEEGEAIEYLGGWRSPTTTVVLVNARQPTSAKSCDTPEEGEAIEYMGEDRQRFNIEAWNGQCCLKWPKRVTDLIATINVGHWVHYYRPV